MTESSSDGQEAGAASNLIPEDSQNVNTQEQSVQQLEQLLATMRLNLEQSKLNTLRVGTVFADSVEAVGPVVSVEVQIEGCPVQAVVDTGAQSTILSRALLHRIAKSMQDSGRDGPELVRPSAKLYGRSGADCSELTITAEAKLEVELDGHHVKVPVFIQPESDIPCLLGMNVLPRLGVQFLRGSRVSLLRDYCGKSTTPEDGNRGGDEAMALAPSEVSPNVPVTEDSSEFRDETVQTVVGSRDKTLPAETSVPEAKVCIVRSTYLPSSSVRVLEAELQSPFKEGDTLIFEPNQTKKKQEGMLIPEVVVTQRSNGRILIPVENHLALSTRMNPGMCVGTATLVDVQSLTELSLVADSIPAAESEKQPKPKQLGVNSVNPGPPVSEEAVERLEKLYSLIALERGTLTEDQYQSLKIMIADNAEVFALDDTELGHTDLVQHRVDTGDSPPIKQSVRRVPFVLRDKIATMVEEMEDLGVIRHSASAWSSPVVLYQRKMVLCGLPEVKQCDPERCVPPTSYRRYFGYVGWSQVLLHIGSCCRILAN